MKRTSNKLTFQKKAFRVLDPRELARIKGGEMTLMGEREREREQQKEPVDPSFGGGLSRENF